MVRLPARKSYLAAFAALLALAVSAVTVGAKCSKDCKSFLKNEFKR